MKICEIPFTVTDWSNVTAQEFPGETGTSQWRIFEEGNIRVRMVEYSANFLADHWCGRGHVLLVLEGELTVELKNGVRYDLSVGSSFQVADDEENPHLVLSQCGAKVFLVD